MTVLDDALAMAARGWPVFPTGGPKGKTPIGGHGFKDATTDPDQVRRLFAGGRAKQVGVALPDGVWAIDVDHPDELPIELPVMQATPSGGFHSVPYIGDGVAQLSHPWGDTRVGGRGYLVAWQPDRWPPVADLVAANPEVVAMVTPKAPAHAQEFEEVEAWGEGERNAMLTAYAGSLRAIGATFNEARAAIEKANAERCIPPLSKQELEATILKSLRSWERGEVLAQPSITMTSASVSAMTTASDVVPRMVHWLWRGWVPLGKLTVLDGRPGIFKSGSMFDLVARVTTGSLMPDGSVGIGHPANAIIVSGEDDPEDTIVPRLMAAGADLTRVFFLDDLELPDGADDLLARVREVSAELVVVDPLVAFVKGTYNLYHDQQSRRALRPLAEVARLTKCAVVGLRHVRKGQPGQPGQAQDGGAGSVAIGGAARSNLLAANDPDMPDHYVLSSIKNNVGRRPPSIGYHIEEVGVETADGLAGVPLVRWDGEVGLTADDLMGGQERQGEAARWLEERLADGPVSAKELKTDALAAGLSWDGAVKRASMRIGVEKTKTGFEGGWEWKLPTPNKRSSSSTFGPEPSIFGEGRPSSDDQPSKRPSSAKKDEEGHRTVGDSGAPVRKAGSR